MFDKIIAAFQNFFSSKNFWLGNFLPVVIGSTFHLLVAKTVFSDLPSLDLLTGSSNYAAKLSITICVLVIAAYALSSLTPFIRGILDGSLLPQRIHDALRREHVIMFRDVRDIITSAYLVYGKYQGMNSSNRLKIARQIGISTAPPASTVNEKNIADAAVAISGLSKLIRNAKLPSPELSMSAIEKLEIVLKQNSASTNQKVDQLHRELINALNYAERDAIHRIESLEKRYRTNLKISAPGATRIADARSIKESYCEDAYQVEFDFLWPRLQLQFKSNDLGVDRMMGARAQSDFALLSLALTVTVAVVWIPILCFYATTPWSLLGVGVLVPLLTVFFYQIAVEAELAYGEEVIALIDFYRFDVIKNVLRLPLPHTLSAEKNLWLSNKKARTKGLLNDLTYRHPPQ